MHDPAYREANAGALRMEWPRIPLPGWDHGESERAAAALAPSAARGRELARLLDPDALVLGVTGGQLRPGIANIAVPATADGRNMTGDDFAVTAGWGHCRSGDAVMPGQGRAAGRDCTPSERKELGDAVSMLGETTFDIYLNNNAFWRNVPAAVWRYELGGYQVLKKWLSYRERGVLERVLTPEEVLDLMRIARRIAAITDDSIQHAVSALSEMTLRKPEHNEAQRLRGNLDPQLLDCAAVARSDHRSATGHDAGMVARARQELSRQEYVRLPALQEDSVRGDRDTP